MLSLKFKTINPATEGIINEYENMTYEHLDNILRNAKGAFVFGKKIIRKELIIYTLLLMNLGKIRTT